MAKFRASATLHRLVGLGHMPGGCLYNSAWGPEISRVVSRLAFIWLAACDEMWWVRNFKPLMFTSCQSAQFFLFFWSEFYVVNYEKYTSATMFRSLIMFSQLGEFGSPFNPFNWPEHPVVLALKFMKLSIFTFGSVGKSGPQNAIVIKRMRW